MSMNSTLRSFEKRLLAKANKTSFDPIWGDRICGVGHFAAQYSPKSQDGSVLPKILDFTVSEAVKTSLSPLHYHSGNELIIYHTISYSNMA